MVQGDAYNLDIDIYTDSGPIDIGSVEQVEIVISNISKLYPGEVSYSDGAFHFPLSQSETFGLPKSCPAQIRVKFKGNNIVGTETQIINVSKSISRRVL